MRRFLSLLCLMLVVPAWAADTEIVRVWPSWREGESFERIGEYFGRSENHFRQVVLRTHPAARSGYYFLVRVKHPAALAAKFRLEVIRPDRPEALPFSFPVEVAAAGETVFQLGLTGADWPDGRKSHPVAWKIELLDSAGQVLAEQRSFLWER